MDKGILLIASGDPYYGKTAYNLAVTIKAVENIPVAIMFSGYGLKYLNKQQLSIFDKVIEIFEPVVGTGAKLLVYDYTPFKRTLYIDADNIWLPRQQPSLLFHLLKGKKFTAITEGRYTPNEGVNDLNAGYTLWADLEQIMASYDLKDLYQWRSEVMYFEKDEKVEEFFNLAKAIYATPKVPIKEFAGAVPDEFAINIAASMLDIKPHVYKWQPTYWYNLQSGIIPKPADLYQKFYILSTGGMATSTPIKKMYDNIVKAAHYKLGLQFLFPLQSKRLTMAERRYI